MCDFETVCEEAIRSHRNSFHLEELTILGEDVIVNNPSELHETKINKSVPMAELPIAVKIYEKTKIMRGQREVDKIQPVVSLSGELKYPCNECEYTTKSKESLKRHLDFVHGGFKLKCDQCNKLYSGDSPLRRHIKRKHKNGKNRFCDLCDFEGNTSDQVWYHKSTKHYN